MTLSSEAGVHLYTKLTPRGDNGVEHWSQAPPWVIIQPREASRQSQTWGAALYNRFKRVLGSLSVGHMI